MPGRQIVHVLERDPDLAQDLDEGSRARAERLSAARTITVATGRWRPPEAVPDENGLVGLLLLDGLVIRRVTLGGRRSAEPLGRGDLIRPFESETDEFSMVPSLVEWRVLQRAELAVLDERFQRSMSAYPEVFSQLLSRVSRRARFQAQQIAAIQQKLTAGVHLLLWMLADRYGRVEADGVVLPLPLSHGLLAEMLGARRPSVSVAVKTLEHHGLVRQRAGRGWWLEGVPPEGFPLLTRRALADKTDANAADDSRSPL